MIIRYGVETKESYVFAIVDHVQGIVVVGRTGAGYALTSNLQVELKTVKGLKQLVEDLNRLGYVLYDNYKLLSHGYSDNARIVDFKGF